MRALTAQEIVEAARRALYLTVRDSQATPEVAFGNLYKHLGLRQTAVEVAWRMQGSIFTRDVAFAEGSGVLVSGVSVETGSGIVVNGGGYA